MALASPTLSPAFGGVTRMVGSGATILAASVLADSAVEHYVGSFDRPAMSLPLAASSLALGGNALLSHSGAVARGSPFTVGINAASVGIGALGLGFHVYNVTRQTGGLSWNNLFYQAPVGAPGALMMSGALGLAAHSLKRSGGFLGSVPLASGRVLAGFTALGLLGTSAEAAILHFRGAYHNKAMWLPVTLPPIAAALLGRAALRGRAGLLAGPALAATAVLGLIGSAFHVYGVSRNMGGWKNWRQNLFAGPPVPAPPGFTGLAIAGLGALRLIWRCRHA